MTDPERLREITERCEKASPGPWYWPFASGSGVSEFDATALNGIGQEVISCDVDSWKTPFMSLRKCDAEFIASARTDIEFLLSHIAAMRG